MNLQRLLVIISPLLIWISSQVYLAWPNLFYHSVILSVILIIVTFFYLKKDNKVSKIIYFTGLTMAFYSSVTTYIALSYSGFLKQTLLIILLVSLYNFFKNSYYKLVKTELYNHDNFSALTSYISFLTIFLSASSLFGLQSLINLKVWPMLLVFLLFVILIFYINLKEFVEETKTLRRFVFLNSWIIIETAIIFVFMPTSYNVSAVSLAIIYYLLFNLSKLYLQNSLSNKKVKLYLSLSFLGLLTLLLTAPWLN